MKIINAALLAEFSAPGLCNICKHPCKRREAHHLLRKGMGGGGRLDVRLNLISLGSTLDWECDCHSRIHDGKIPHKQVLEVVAAREKCIVEDVEVVLYWLARLDAKRSQAKLLALLDESLTNSQSKLARRELTEAGRLTNE